jgi:hypothetical protein
LSDVRSQNAEVTAKLETALKFEEDALKREDIERWQMAFLNFYL